MKIITPDHRSGRKRMTYRDEVEESNNALKEDGRYMHPTLMTPDYHLLNKPKEKVPFENLIGRRFDCVKNSVKNKILFMWNDRVEFVLMHKQQCCEDVTIEEIIGDLNDLTDFPITDAKFTSENTKRMTYVESKTNSSYRIETEKGKVKIEVVGYSNGDYSEVLDLYWIKG
jgi:hypothetical protein